MEPLTFETYNGNTAWNNADCQDVGKLNASLRCNFTRTTPDCIDSDGYINYLDGAFCSFPPNVFPLAIFLYTLWLLYLFIILAVTAEKFFCPNLSAISRILRLSHNVAGVTFLAFGNGAPDVFSALAAFSDSRTAGLAIGALFGAGVFVTTVVAGGISIVKPFTAASRPFLRDIVFYISAIFLTFFVLYQGYVTLAEALVYLLLYLVYVFVVVLSTWIYRRMRQQQLSVPVTEEPDLLGESEDDCITTPHGSEYGDEYQPLFPMQRSTWQILTSELNPVDARKWKQKSWKWRTFKMIKEHLFSFLGFVASALWISATATEVVNLLRTFGVIFRLSNTVLGLTLLAWGNSIGDFVSDITLARQGYPRMAFSACFGGIIFNVLIGVGLGCLMQMRPSKTSFQLEHQGLLVWILAGGLGISLVFSLISVPAQSFHLRRGYGVALLFIYVLFLTVALLTEFGVIRLEMF